MNVLQGARASVAAFACRLNIGLKRQPYIGAHPDSNVWVTTAAGALLLATAFWVRRHVLAWPNEGLVLNTDEFGQVFSALDRLLGLPSVTLAWPGAALQFITLLTLPFHYLAGYASTDPNSLTFFIAAQYEEPWRLLASTRLIVLIVYAAGVLAMARALMLSAGFFVAVSWGLALLLNPLLAFHSVTATGDGLAAGFFLLGFFCASKSNSDRWLILTGAAAGAVLASKLYFAILLPPLVCLALDNSPRRLRACAVLGISMAISFLVLCPYVWTDPVRLAKSVLGNAGRAGEPLGLLNYLIQLGNQSGWAPLLLFPLLARSLLKANRWLTLAGLTCTLLVSALIFSRAGVVYDRYHLPAVLGLFAFLAIAGQRLAALPPPMKELQLVAFASACILGSQAILHITRPLNPVPVDVQKARSIIMSNPDRCDAALISLHAMPYVLPVISVASIERASEIALRSFAESTTAIRFAQAAGLPPRIARTFSFALAEDELTFGARLRVIAAARTSASGKPAQIFTATSQKERFGLASPETAWTTPPHCRLVQLDDEPIPKGAAYQQTNRLIFR